MGNFNIIELEKQKNFLNEQLARSRSAKRRALLIHNFFETLEKTNDERIEEAYICEFIDEYLNCLLYLKSLSIHPKLLELLLNKLSSLQRKTYLKDYYSQIQMLMENTKEQIKVLEKILAGERYEYFGEGKIYFPVLEAERFNDALIFSSLESLTITIEKTKDESSFLIVPRERDLEEKIEKQVQNSWSAAINFCRKFIRKISPAHKVLIYFDKMQGIYSGNSLGIALTLGFIEQLLKIYNAPTVVYIKKGVAFTGRMDTEGNVSEVSKEIIEKKTECIFFSPIETFVVHKNDEAYCQKRLRELKDEFPNRNLEAVSVTSLTDLLNRRNLVDIRKQSPFTRASNRAKNNAVSLMLGAVLLLVIFLSGIWDMDDNPARLVNEGNIMYVKNENNKLLWSKEMVFELQTQQGSIIPFSEKLVDVNNDGINEVIICNELLYDKSIRTKYGRAICVNNDQELLWEYQFKDSIYTRDFLHSITYRNNIIDTFTHNSEKALLMFARNIPLYPNIVFKLDLKTGKRIDSSKVLMHAGGINAAMLGDFDENGVEELVAVAINNGLERAVIFSIDVDKIYGQSPAPPKYTFRNMPVADFNSYILLPISDYGKLFFRFNSPALSSLIYYKDSKEFQFYTVEGIGNNIINIHYRFTNDLNFIRLDCGDEAQFKRDSLVSGNILSEPYTNTNEYYELLKEQIKYWDGEKFTSR